MDQLSPNKARRPTTSSPLRPDKPAAELVRYQTEKLAKLTKNLGANAQ